MSFCVCVCAFFNQRERERKEVKFLSFSLCTKTLIFKSKNQRHKQQQQQKEHGGRLAAPLARAAAAAAAMSRVVVFRCHSIHRTRATLEVTLRSHTPHSFGLTAKERGREEDRGGPVFWSSGGRWKTSSLHKRHRLQPAIVVRREVHQNCRIYKKLH